MNASEVFKKLKFIFSIILIQIINYILAFNQLDALRARLHNQKRKRDHFEEMISALSDTDFISATGLSRTSFKFFLNILIKIKYLVIILFIRKL